MAGITNGTNKEDGTVRYSSEKKALEYLIAQKINDPEVDLFYNIICNDIIKVSEALQKGANPDATLSEVLQRHKRVLDGR